MPDITRIEDASPSRKTRLLRAAASVFAAKGFERASTREICQAAGVNIGLIAYYFGDKLGLYRALMEQPVAEVMARMPPPDAALPLTPWLRGFYTAFLLPLRDGDEAMAQLMRLCARETLEPSAVYLEICQQSIAPHHHALVAMLAQRCGVAEVDAELHQLGFALVALVFDYWMSADYMEAVVPGLVYGPEAFERILHRLVGYGQALIEHEIALRQGKENKHA